jgi:ABC-2 type transport system permease protein
MDKIFLRALRWFDPVLAKAGVNIDQLHEILRIKLLMDNRRPRSLFSTRKAAVNANKKVTNPLLVSFFTLLLGFFIGMLLFFNEMPLTGHTFYFTIFMVLMCFTIVSDFTTVLIDTRDQFILLPRPVDDRTIAVSRILHITIYVLRLALIQGLPGIIMVGFADKNALASPLFLIEILEATFLCILMVNLIYLGMMRSVNPQKFKDLISSFQIGFTILVFAVYYLLPRLIDKSSLAGMDLLSHWWAYLLPPVWIASFNQVLIHPGQANIIISLLAVLGIVSPLAGLWFVIKVLAPGFNKKLAILATSDGNAPDNAVKKVYKQDFRDKVANFITPDPIENAGFRITWKLAARTREFKMKAYPSFGFVPIMFLYITLSGKGASVADKFNRIQSGQNYFILMYLSTIVLSSMLITISQSEKYKASWVYYALPIDQPGKILSGMYKAIITLYYFPFCLILGIGVVLVWGPQVINDVILAFLICMVYGVLIALFSVKGLPFSKPVMAKQGGGRAVTNLVTMGLIGLLGYAHFLLRNWETAIWISIIPMLIITWAMLHYYRKQTWESIELSEV